MWKVIIFILLIFRFFLIFLFLIFIDFCVKVRFRLVDEYLSKVVVLFSVIIKYNFIIEVLDVI